MQNLHSSVGCFTGPLGSHLEISLAQVRMQTLLGWWSGRTVPQQGLSILGNQVSSKKSRIGNGRWKESLKLERQWMKSLQVDQQDMKQDWCSSWALKSERPRFQIPSLYINILIKNNIHFIRVLWELKFMLCMARRRCANAIIFLSLSMKA